jgi:hypothetical protein
VSHRAATTGGGYVAIVAQSQTFAAVTPAFVVPTLDCSATVGQPAGGRLLELWSGLDGAKPGAPISVEQVGVDPECHDGVQSNPSAYGIQFLNKKGKLVQAGGRIALNGSIFVPTGDSITATVSHRGSFTASSATDSLGHTGGLVTSGPWWNTEQLTLIGTDMAGHRLVPHAAPGPYDTVSGAFTMIDTGNCVVGS